MLAVTRTWDSSLILWHANEAVDKPVHARGLCSYECVGINGNLWNASALRLLPFILSGVICGQVSIAKLLRHNESSNPSIHNPNPDAAEILMQDVGAVAGRVH